MFRKKAYNPNLRPEAPQDTVHISEVIYYNMVCIYGTVNTSAVPSADTDYSVLLTRVEHD